MKAAIVAIIIIGILEGLAIFKGINGATMASAFVIIGGLGGYYTSQARKR